MITALLCVCLARHRGKAGLSKDLVVPSQHIQLRVIREGGVLAVILLPDCIPRETVLSTMCHLVITFVKEAALSVSL